ncbi:MAG: hypothetical protein K9N49_10730, partial [Candidatus Marinimicrobia bacterium]|nr:hypothetical protein [Candidatus Neomarinimicrobiota bacterium]
MKRPRAIFLLLSLGALLVYLAGAVWHLDLARQPPEALWGDAGDGLFNGWILEQGLRSAPGGFQELRAGRIFWPDGANSFFWSDNLLAVLPLYALARALTPGLLEALRWTVHGLSGLHYAALVFLFYQACALATVGAPPRSRRGLWAVPLFAYWAHFTPQLILNHFNHLQNFCGLGLFVFAGAALAYRRRPAGRWIVLMAVAALGLLYSAPYYAVAVFVLGLGWGALEAVAHPRELMTRARRAAPGLLVVALVAWPLLRAYLDARLPTYAPRDLIRLAIAWTSVYTPAATVSADWLRRAGCALPAVSSEQLAWWGGGWLLGLILAVSRWGGVRWGGWSAGWWRQPVLGLILLALFAPQPKIRELRPVPSLIGLVGWAALLSWLIAR